MIEKIRNYIETKVSEAKLEPYTFPHLIIENLFADEVFQKILEYNPFKANVGTEWISAKESATLKTGTPYFARKQINFHSNPKLFGKEEEQNFWKQIKDCFLSDRWFENLVVNKYKEYFVIRFGELVESALDFGLAILD